MQDADLVRLCAAIYDPTFTGWEHYWDGSAPDGICAGIKNNCLITRGSITMRDWIRDFEVIRLGASKFHSEFGTVHAGMDFGLDDFAAKAFPHLSEGAYFSGHSLGAAHAWGLAGRYIIEGGMPGGITVIGSPRYGCFQFAEFVNRAPKSSYRNGYDPVTEVPFLIGMQMGVHPTAPKHIKIEPTNWIEGMMAWHNVNLYQQGIP